MIKRYNLFKNHFINYLLIFYTVSSCQMDEAKVVVPPTLSTTFVTNISANSAKSGGNITSDGGAAIIGRGVVWNTTSNPTVDLTTKTIDGDGPGNFSSNLTSLSLSTKYYIRAYATNSSGTSYGEELFFTTSFDKPSIATSEVTNITSIKARSGGNITNDGGSKILARGVVWSTSPNPIISLETKTMDGDGVGNFTSNFSGLSKSTKYYIRAYATNSYGTGYGEERPFATSKYPTLFNIIFDGLESQRTDIASTKDGGFILSANKYIIKTDSLGVVQWKTEVNPNSPALYQIFQSKDGGYVLCNHLSIQKYSSDGNILWTKEQPTFNYVYNSVVETDDGYFVAGIKGPSNTGTITKLNLEGVQLWEKLYDQSLITDCINIIKSSDGNFIVVGGSGIPSTTLASLKIDSNGNVIWSRQYNDTNQLVSTASVKVIEVADGTFVISSNTADSRNILTTRIVGIDQDGTKKWEKSILMGNQVRSNAFILLSDGGFIIAGSLNYSPTSALIVKIDNSGNQIWNKIFYSESSPGFLWEFNAVVETKAHTLTFLGYKSYVYSGTERGLWLLRTDDEGNY